MTTSSQSIDLLSEVFYKGLPLGLVSKADIVKWADETIMNELEPDYFFIELAMAKNANELMEVLNQTTKFTNNRIVFRVLLGLVYYKLNNGDINLIEASLLMDTVNCKAMGILTDNERDYMYQFDDEIQWMYKTDDKEKRQLEVLQFLSAYQDLKLDSYTRWIAINERIEVHFQE